MGTLGLRVGAGKGRRREQQPSRWNTSDEAELEQYSRTSNGVLAGADLWDRPQIDDEFRVPPLKAHFGPVVLISRGGQYWHPVPTCN